MLRKLCDWLDHRTGYRQLMQLMLLEHIPGGAKWRYVWGSCLAFVFLLQVVTGILLMTAYSPGNSTAWGSVYFIQYEMEFGWLIRGLHHFGSQMMVVLLGIHLLQVVIAGAHLPPREINWWLGLGLMGLVLAMSLTGYLLPWDQKGYYATQVATNIAGSIPGAGNFARRVIVGGPEYGSATLTRFYALHVAIIPALIVLLLIAHIALFRRHGVTAPKDAKGEGLFWPDQAFRDLVACVLVFAVMMGLVIWGGHGNPVDHKAFHHPTAEEIENQTAAPEPGWWDHVALAGRDGRGADLDAPSDPGQPYPARPEWYFLFLFQLLKYFEGDKMIIGTVVIPNGVGLLLFLLPLLGHGKMRTFGHIFGVIVVVSLLSAIGSLTCLALADDMAGEATETVGLRRALLTRIGMVLIPAVGAYYLLYLAALALLNHGTVRRIVSIFGGAVLGLLLVGVGSLIYGAMSGCLPDQVRTFMAERMTSDEKDPSSAAQTKAKSFNDQLKKAEIAAKRAVELAPHGIPAEGAVLLLHRDPKTRGRELFKLNCASCHSYNYKGESDDDFHKPKDNVKFRASDLAGFGTKDWILGLLRDPDHARYFGHTRFKEGTMSTWATEASKKIRADFEGIAEWLGTHPKTLPQPTDPAPLHAGFNAFKNRCLRCHSFAGEGGTSENTRGPDFTGYGDSDWLRQMIAEPHDRLRYGRNNANAMPLFRDKEQLTWPIAEEHLARHRRALFEAKFKEFPDEMPQVIGALWSAMAGELSSGMTAAGVTLATQVSQLTTQNVMRVLLTMQEIKSATEVIGLSEVERELIIRFMLNDDRVVFGGSPIGPKKR